MTVAQELGDLLDRLHEYMDDRADGEVVGDPPGWEYNREAHLASDIEGMQAALRREGVIS